MPVEVTCDHEGCHTAFEVGDEGDWSVAPENVASFALEGSGYGALVYLYLPVGWVVETVKLAQVIHCPVHAKAGPGQARSGSLPDRPDDSQRYWGD